MAAVIHYLLSRRKPLFGRQKLHTYRNEVPTEHGQAQAQDDTNANDDESASDNMFLLPPYLNSKQGYKHVQNDKMMMCPKNTTTNLETSASTLSTLDMMDSLTSLDEKANDDESASDSILLLPLYLNNKQGYKHDQNDKMMMCPKSTTNLETSASTLSTLDMMDSLTSLEEYYFDDDEQDDSTYSQPPVHHQQQQHQQPKAVRFAMAANGLDLKTTVYRYPAATCPVTHGLTCTTATIDSLDFAETRSRLCAVLYWSEDEMWLIRSQHLKRAAVYTALSRRYVPCVECLFDERGFAASPAPRQPNQESSKQKVQSSLNYSKDNNNKAGDNDDESFTEKDAIRIITSASIRGLEYPCSTKMQRHRQWAKDKILDCQDDCRRRRRIRNNRNKNNMASHYLYNAADNEAAQCLADVCTRVSRRPKAFARKLAMGDARAAQEISMSQDGVTTSRRELQLLNSNMENQASSSQQDSNHTYKEQQATRTTRKSQKQCSSPFRSCPLPQQQQQQQQRQRQRQRRPAGRDRGSF